MRNILLLLASFLISLIVGEMLIRVIQPQQLIVLSSEIWRPDDVFGWRHQENTTTTVNTGEGVVQFMTNRDGHRINASERETREEYDFRILVLGDSFLEALQVENEETIPELIRATISTRFSKRLRADNTGVAGWDPNRYLLEAENSLPRHDYDLGIVFLYVENDVVTRKQSRFLPKQIELHPWRMPTALTWKEVVNSTLYPLNETLERMSHSYVFVKNSSQKLLAKLGLTAYYFPSNFLKSKARSRRWQITAEICAEIQAIFDNYSTPVIFVLLPSVHQVRPDVLYQYADYFDVSLSSVDIEQPSRLLFKEFLVRELRFIDLLPFLREKAASGTRLYGRVDTHLNQNGHKAVAEAIIPIIEEYLFTQNRSRKSRS